MSSLAQRLQSASGGDISFLDAERRWLGSARPKQVLPIDGWSLALAMSGRGFGKTMMGASWVRRQAGLYPGCVIHAVAPTYGDLRGVVFGGPSGLLNQLPAPMIAQVNHSLFEIRLYNGTLIRGYSAEAPDRLRGPQCHFLWGDELAAWGHTAEEMLANIDMSTRLAYRTHDGRLVQPQRFYTTTPRPLQWLKKIIDREDTLLVIGSTYENRANLADSFLRELEQYEGTQIGRQEIHGELIDIGESAIIKRSWLKLWPVDDPLPWFDFVFVSLDTAMTDATFDKKSYDPDYTACTVWGVFAHERRWNLMLLECWHEKIGFPDLIMKARRELAAIYGRRSETFFKPLVGQSIVHEQKRRPDLLIIEDKGFGIGLRQMLAAEGIDSWPYNPGRADKTSRLHAVSHVAAAGRVWLPESKHQPGEPRSWCNPFLDEVCVFSGPGTTKHDDFVDSFSQGVRYFADRWLNTGVSDMIKPDTITASWDEDDQLPQHLNYGESSANPYDA